MAGIYNVLQPISTENQITIEQFLRNRGGDAVSRSYSVKVANKSLQLSADDVPPWKKCRKPKAPPKQTKWGPPRSITTKLKAKKKALVFDCVRLQALHRLWLDKVRESVPARPSSDHISRIDLVGAQLKVISSSCPSLVGKEGIVVQETANSRL